MIDAAKSNSTDGRTLYRRWRFGDWEYRSDLISHDYMRRWTIKTPWFHLRLHKFLRGDLDRHFHDHPMSFASLILVGGYVEHRPGHFPRVMRPGSVVVHRGEDLHRVELIGKTCWTFLITSPFYREWGFSTEDGWIVAREYDAWKKRKAERQNGVSL